ncbi:hypothetical protein K474DRAFT_1606564 [Panus rudis PR-1116 ss-1]|nr:hypothetical protein K474DRAFT_1606564 [Panus rudis PR-1116 ss-1]
MYVPGITQRLYPRKGGGGHGGGHAGGHSEGGKAGGSKGGSSGSGGSKGDVGSKSGSSSGGGRGAAVPLSGSSPKSGRSVSTYNQGGGPMVTIPSGQPFAGRAAGGGSRDQVFGSQTYGSGYPPSYSAPGRGVSGLGFPFYFWPLAWGGGLGYGAGYLHSHEYGEPNNSSRPGGPVTTSAFVSSSFNSTFHVLADNTTVTLLVPAIESNCTNFNLNTTASSSSPSPYNSSDPLQPRPEQVVQYYRGSSVALTLDGYNDTTALQDKPTEPHVPIPSWVDMVLLDCLNQTIGAAVPLVDADSAARGGSDSGSSGGGINPDFTPSAGSIANVPVSALWLLCSLVCILL